MGFESIIYIYRSTMHNFRTDFKISLIIRVIHTAENICWRFFNNLADFTRRYFHTTDLIIKFKWLSNSTSIIRTYCAWSTNRVNNIRIFKIISCTSHIQCTWCIHPRANYRLLRIYWIYRNGIYVFCLAFDNCTKLVILINLTIF